MAEIDDGITLNSGEDTVSLREWIAGHVGHVDEGVHEIRQAIARMEAKVNAMHAELETARPLIERWQHSAIRRLATGQFPWQQT